MEDLQGQLNRVFDEMLAPRSERNGVGVSFTPAAEIEETAEAYHLRLEVPGMESKDLTVEVTAEAVSISGERKYEKRSEAEGLKRTEFRYGKFQRVLPLPGRINHQNVTAAYTNGILSLTLPKADEEKNKVVKVQIG
jgi:HSP20 family protein